MNKKHLKLLLSILLVSFLSIQAVSAASTGFFQNNPFFKSLFDLLGEPLSWPPFNVTHGIIPPGTDKVPFFLVLLTWIAMFAVIYVLANKIDFFKDSPHKNAIMWFSFAFAGITVASTTFVNNLALLLDFTQSGLLGVGSIVILFLLIGLLFSGVRLGGGMALPGHFGGKDQKLENIKEGREVDAAQRELANEKKLYEREEKGVDKAEQLLKRNVMGISNSTDRLRHLLKVVEELQKVRTEGAALPLRQSFERQAAAVMGQLMATSNYTKQETDLSAQLAQISSVDFTTTNTTLNNRERQLKRDKTAEEHRWAAALAGPTHPTSREEDEHKKKMQELDGKLTLIQNTRSEITQLARKISDFGTTMQNTLTNLQNNAPKIAQAVEAAIRDVHSGSYPSAISLLNQTINDQDKEVVMLREVDSVLKQSEQIRKEERDLVDRAGKI